MDSTTWDARYAEAGLVWSEQPNQFAEEVFTPLPAGAALDLATGEGRNAIWLAARGWRVTAVDFSAVGIAKARALARARGVTVDWMVADLHDGVGGPQNPAILYTPATIAAELTGLHIVRAERVTRAVPGDVQYDQRRESAAHVGAAPAGRAAVALAAIDTLVVAVRE